MVVRLSLAPAAFRSLFGPVCTSTHTLSYERGAPVAALSYERGAPVAALSYERGAPVAALSYERGTPVAALSYERGTPVDCQPPSEATSVCTPTLTGYGLRGLRGHNLAPQIPIPEV